MALPSLKVVGGTDTETAGSPAAQASGQKAQIQDAMKAGVGGAEPPAPTKGLEPSLEHLEQVVENTAQISNFTRENPLTMKNTESMIFRLYEIRDELRVHTEKWDAFLGVQAENQDRDDASAEEAEREDREGDRAEGLEPPVTGDDTGDAVKEGAGGAGKIKKGGPLGKFMKMFKGILGWFALAAVLIGGIFMSDGGGEFIQKLVDMFKTIWESLQPLLAVIMEEVLPPVMDLFGRLAEMFGNIVAELMPVIVNLIEELWPIVMSVFNSVMDLFLKIVDFLMPVVKVIISMVAAAADNLGGMVETFVNLLGDLFVSPMLFLKNIPDTIISALANMINGFIGMINKVLPERWSIPEVKFGEAAEARMAKRRAEYEEESAQEKVDIVEEHADKEDGVPVVLDEEGNIVEADEIKQDAIDVPAPATDGTQVAAATAEEQTAQRAATTVPAKVDARQTVSNAPVQVSSTTSTQKISYSGDSLTDSNFGTAGAF